MELIQLASGSILGLAFGGDSGAAHRLLGEPLHQFRRTPDSGLTEFYPDRGVMLTYDHDGRLEFVELVPPARPAWHAIELLDRPYGQVVADLRAAGLDDRPYDSGVDYPEVGLRLYTGHPSEPAEPVESAGRYRPGDAGAG